MLGDDDLVARFELALDDFSVGVVVEAGGHCDPNCFAVAQHPDPALLGRPRSAGRAASPRCTGGHRCITQRLARHAQNVGALVGDDAVGCGHAGLERQIGIVDADHHVIGHHVLHGLRRLPHLHDGSFEGALREGIDGEDGLVAVRDAADVAFAHIGVDLHLGEVGGDEKKRRGLKAGRHRLPHGHVARHHRAVHR